MLPFKISFVCVMVFGNMLWAQEKKIEGKVLSDGFPVKAIEVINSRNKNMVKTNAKGEFSIQAATNDELIVYSEHFQLKKVKLDEKDFMSNPFRIELAKKTIELKEVEVKKEAELNVDVSSDALYYQKIEKEQDRPKPIGVYTGETVNGIDFVKVGEKILVLFKDKSEKKRKKEAVEAFRSHVASDFSKDFFINTLHLEEREIPDFIDFCSKDFASIPVPQNNTLDVIAFLIEKRSEYRK
ncbi:hypothetical protein [Flavobacterium sp. GCM10027622]|uniref:hypothetical protein n=1 Tax=unclassified Flavobacterium TaxID=196869 RepID=UPI003605CD0F